LSSFISGSVYLHYRGFRRFRIVTALTPAREDLMKQLPVLSVTREYYCRMLLSLCKEELMALNASAEENIRI
jgi:hypothetical protein